jgi:phenylacetate-CoA ligase
MGPQADTGPATSTAGDAHRGTIGHLGWSDIHQAAHDLAALGGPPVSSAATSLAELPVTGPAEILAVSRAVSRPSGGIAMSSGGTTGRPKLTIVPYHQALDRLLAQWRPLEPDDVLLNLFTPGRLWASHYYMQALAERCRCDVIPAGPYEVADAAVWLPTFTQLHTTTAAGTPTALADLARAVLDAGRPMPLRKLIWMAEPWTAEKEAVVRAAFPGVEFWGNYGSVETYVMATNDPRCDAATLHLMLDQLLELDDAGALLTRRGADWTVPTVRYRLGDRVAAVRCRCGRPDGLRVIERADDAVKLHGALVRIGQVLGVVRGCPGVTDAQLMLTRGGTSKHDIRHITVCYTGEALVGDVHTVLLRDVYDLGVVTQHHPDAVSTVAVAELGRVRRTNKVPPMLWRDPELGDRR